MIQSLEEQVAQGKAIDITEEVVEDRREFLFDWYDKESEDESDDELEITKIKIEIYIRQEKEDALFYVIYELQDEENRGDPQTWCIDDIVEDDFISTHKEFPLLMQMMARYALSTNREFLVEGVPVKEYFSEDDIDPEYYFLMPPAEDEGNEVQ